ncbi:hypothetical protein JOQ06_028591 [Pogonophryne albipinna]|uniref:ALMS motif domain-containing protein n=1 Tax=Pogonophryne albipinna TaxID=1090488 RepID=A0AAD6BA76_9TELE|nr:hypothetical protein JOQ06_028591 [Pogonophryne albipinna]
MYSFGSDCFLPLSAFDTGTFFPAFNLRVCYQPPTAYTNQMRVTASARLPADEDTIQSVGQTSINQPGAQSHDRQRQPRLDTDSWELQQRWQRSFEPEFQDSNLSPSLSLLPAHSGVEQNFTEYSLFQQSDSEFAPLRALPDISMASERFHVPLQDHTSQASERGSLSQYPLDQATNLSGEGVSSCCSLSQHSLSPGDEGRREEKVHPPAIATTYRRGVPSSDDSDRREEDSGTQTDPSDTLVGEAAQYDISFLSKDIPAQHLLELLEKDIGMQSSSSSSALSSSSETSVKVALSFAEDSKSIQVCKPGFEQRMGKREGPPGEASFPHQQSKQPDRGLFPDQSQTLSSEESNITMGLRSTKPDDSSEELHRELLSEVERRSSREHEFKNQQRKSSTPPVISLTPFPTGASEVKPSAIRTHFGGLQWTGAFSAGFERGHREQDLWLSGNHTGIDGSYLGFIPQSQSTPGVFKAPSKSSVKAKLGQLSAIESNIENSSQSNTGISPQPAVPATDPPETTNQSRGETTSAEVQSLPSLNYMQKVDAWRANQSSGKAALFDSLALQGFSSVSPKQNAYEAVSEPLNRILSQQAGRLQPIAAHQEVTQSSSKAPSGSTSPRRGEAVGRAPRDQDNSATRTSASPFGRSQSHSSLSTIVMSVQKDQQSKIPAGEENIETHHQPSTTVQPPPRISLGQFSDVSLDHDLTLSSSQESYNSGVKLATSIGASSVVSLEVDNYAPYWTSKMSTPPPMARQREIDIEQRIPLYLRNLGIDQSPSTILTPFAPRGPIREPEFSPTDLCTIKGSIGTPTKSPLPSEGGSPHKGEFSRCSILSVDSSISIPLSLDSLGESERRLAPSSLPDEDSYPSSPQQHMDSSLTSSQNTITLGDRYDSDLSLATKSTDSDLESPLQTSRSLEQSAEDSMVSSKALMEIRKLLSQAENMVSSGSSLESSAPTAVPRLLSDDNIFLSLRKTPSTLQDSSSSVTEDPRARFSPLWARSASDSILTSERLRENSIGRETSSGQPNYPSTQALTSTGAYRRPQDVGRGAGSLVLSLSARRAEPEGCSAAPVDNTVPPQPPSPALSIQLTSTATDTEEEMQASLEGPIQSSSPPPALENSDQEVMSDGSSESLLAVRVAQLLQNESPATMVSSTASITDNEESKALEWIKLKISGQQCEPLVLDKEDRRRIEEIKRDLLLKNPMKSQGSTDTESSTASSIQVFREPDPLQKAATLPPPGVANKQLLPGLHTDLSYSSLPLQNLLRPDLEAQINAIAAKEGGISQEDAKEGNTQCVRQDEELSVQINPAPGVDQEHEHATGSSTSESLDRTGHVSHVRLTLSPKAKDVRSSHTDAVVKLPQKEFVPLRPSSSAASSPDEGVGLCSPPEWYDTQRGPKRADTSTLFKTSVPQGGKTSTSTQSFTPRSVVSQRTLPTVSPAVPVLLPYKPRGSEELFYIPQTEAGVSSIEPSETTMESSHTGSDDAVPPRFSSDVLGRRDAGVERGVPIRHSEGIYSRRLKPGGVKMQELRHRGVSANGPSQTRETQTPKPSPQATAAAAAPPRLRDQGTSPLQFPSCAQPEQNRVRFQPDVVDVDSDTALHHLTTSSVPQRGGEGAQERRDSHLRPPAAPQSSSTLDQLWESFCDRWSPEESRPISEREASLLQRLERLSRLIHSTRGNNMSGLQEGEQGRSREDATGKERTKDVGVGSELRGGRKVEGEPPVLRQAWTQSLHVEETSVPAEEDSFTCSSSQSPHLCPADRDESEALSSMSGSGSMSTVDTARLVRAFGAHRVQSLKTSSGLRRLYSAIDKQKEGRQPRRGGGREPSHITTLSETTGTDESTVAPDSASSTSTYTLPSPRGPSRTLAAKKAVRVVSRGIQTGDLEIVSNGTPRHTRDVGTTFPSPGEARTSSSSSLDRGGEGGRSQGSQKQRKSKRSPPKSYPEGVSWFIAAEDLRSEGRKENRPEEEETSRPSSAWFEPHSKMHPWREPLRQRQIHEEGNRHHAEHDLERRTKTISSGLARISLQEALEMRRPDFISQSRRRVKCLALQAEDRKRQEVFIREREDVFSWTGAKGRLLRPKGTALLRRAVPRKEMIQRSKQ